MGGGIGILSIRACINIKYWIFSIKFVVYLEYTYGT